MTDSVRSTALVRIAIDAVTGAVSYTRFFQMEEALRAARFTHDRTGPISRWIAPNGEVFDLTSAGQLLGGTGAAVDQWAIDTAVPIPEHPQLRQLSGPGYFIMKAAAFSDRGRRNPTDSKDLADLAVLLVGREGLLTESEATPPEMQALIAQHAEMLLASSDLIGGLRGHFADRRPIPPDTPDSLAMESLDVLHALVRLSNDI